MSSSAPPPAIASWPVVLAVPIAWGEMDALGHVNNIVYLRWFESARMAYFDRLGYVELTKSAGVGPILHSTRVRFRLPLSWPDEIYAATRVGEIGEDRFTMLYQIWSRGQARLAAEGSGIVVHYDYRAGAKAPLPDAIRRGIDGLERGGVEG